MNRHDIRKVLSTFMQRGLINIEQDGDDALKITFTDQKQPTLELRGEPIIPGHIRLECQRGHEFWISPQDIQAWQKAYPGVDVNAEIRKMDLWLKSNFRHLKTKAGMPKFVLAWLGRAQDRSPVSYNQQVVTRPVRKDDVQAGLEVDLSHERWLQQMRELDANFVPATQEQSRRFRDGR